MTILATTKRNESYTWARCIDFVIQARLVNGRVMYYEIAEDRENNISEELVKALFPIGTRIIDRPFLARENRNFYAVLNRHKNRYKDLFKELKKQKDGSKTIQNQQTFRRTKQATNVLRSKRTNTNNQSSVPVRTRHN